MMPADIRNFFGGKGSQGSNASTGKEKPQQREENSGKRKRSGGRKVIEDSDDDEGEEPPQKATPKKVNAKTQPKEISPKGEETTTSEYFGSAPKNKAKRSAASKPEVESTIPTSPAPKSPTRNGSRKISAKSKPSTRRTPMTKQKPDYAESGDDEEFETMTNGSKPPNKATKLSKATHSDDENLEPDKDEIKAGSPRTKRPGAKDGETNDRRSKPNGTPSKAGRKRKSTTLEDAENEDEAETVKGSSGKRPKPAPSKSASTKSPKKPAPGTTQEVQDIFDSIPTVDAPAPPAPSGEPKKFDFKNQAQRAAPPPAAGTKVVPKGAENCLAGLTFVFTGILESLGRDEGQELVKKYGGKVVGSPSTKTSYVVLGDEAGPKKLETIRKNNLKAINEDGLFELIRRLPANGGDSEAAAKHEEKMKKEQEKIKQMAAEMEREQRQANKSNGNNGAGASQSQSQSTSQAKSDHRLWTTKYAPGAMNQICGNKGQVEKLQRWLREWPKSHKIGFKKPGKDGSFSYRAVIIHGPPGIGKTTAAHVVAKLEGYDILESNASDTRSKKLVETGLKGVLDNTSLMGYFAGGVKEVAQSKKKLVLIMDEVDGMSAGDRGGVGALAQVCKKTNIPMILICNERRQPKMKPFDYVTYDLGFRRPTVAEIRSRMSSICYREGLRLPPQLIDALIEGTHSDIRQIINMISTVKLDQEAMTFDKGVSMSKQWEKHIILKPWDIAQKLLSAGWFAASSNKTLNDKIELYFNDHEFSYLMLQENYLKTNPSIASRESGKEKNLKALELADKAAESISDGDLVDRMIHGSQQQWSLMPTHAVFSTVRPASFVYGSLGGQASFTSWLGNNSKQSKLTRYVKEIQGHMRLRSSADRHAVRQHYLPVFWTELVKRLQTQGKESVPDVIELMDSYFLTKEDFDAIIELGLGPMSEDKVSIDTQTKSTFTRLYNQQSHPLPFMKASNVVAPKKQTKERPDLEEAIEASDEGEDPGADKDAKQDEEEELDVTKDKYVKQPKKKATGKGAKKAAAPKKAKGAKNEDDDFISDSGEEKPKKGKGKGKGRAKK